MKAEKLQKQTLYYYNNVCSAKWEDIKNAKIFTANVLLMNKTDT